MRQEATTEAKNLLRSSFVGVISTHSQSVAGYPFGSVSPYLCDSDGSVYFYISDIAQHAKNLVADSRMSVTVFKESEQGDQNTQGRLTLIGDTTVLDTDKQAEVLARYIRLYPKAKAYEKTHDFKLWHMDIKRVRYIGGFGKIFWLEKEEWLTPQPSWDAHTETDMIEHMNQDHQNAMAAILKAHFQIDAGKPQMSGILSEGCFIQQQQKNYWLPFPHTCNTPIDVRKALVDMTQNAREQ